MLLTATSASLDRTLVRSLESARDVLREITVDAHDVEEVLEGAREDMENAQRVGDALSAATRIGQDESHDADLAKELEELERALAAEREQAPATAAIATADAPAQVGKADTEPPSPAAADPVGTDAPVEQGPARTAKPEARPKQPEPAQ
jgi:hypothetical protein